MTPGKGAGLAVRWKAGRSGHAWGGGGGRGGGGGGQSGGGGGPEGGGLAVEAGVGEAAFALLGAQPDPQGEDHRHQEQEVAAGPHDAAGQLLVVQRRWAPR